MDLCIVLYCMYVYVPPTSPPTNQSYHKHATSTNQQTQACLEAGEKQRALGLWDEMVASGMRSPSKETLSLAMAAALDLRDWDRIDALLTLNPAGVRVDQRFFSDMMAGFVQSGRWASALNLLRVLGEGEGGADAAGGGVPQRVTAGFYEQVRIYVCIRVVRGLWGRG